MAAPLAVVIAAAVAVSGFSALAPDPGRLPGPIPATLLDVVDGDTLRVRALIWIDLELETLVRLRGIDAPELRGKCEAEKLAARDSRAGLEVLAGAGPLALRQVEYEKYAGRVVADVSSAEGHDLAALMLSAGLARPYDGGKREGWCG